LVTVRVRYTPAYRLISARLPRIDIFERIAYAANLPGVLEVEALTNPRLRPTVGPIREIAVADRIVGRGSAFVMAAFAYPQPSRLRRDGFGTYYAADALETSVAEVAYHRARFAARTPTPPMDFDERIVEATIDADLVDFRDVPMTAPLYDPDGYAAGQAEGERVRAQRADGVLYHSVRRLGYDCVGIMKPRVVKDAHTSGYVGLRWDGRAIVDSYRKAALQDAYPDAS